MLVLISKNKFMRETVRLHKTENKENDLSPRERLLILEKEGKFVFHGSPDNIDTLEPRQPFIFDIKSKIKEKHGEPCVVATPRADIAIFRAIVNPKNFPEKEYASSFSINKDDTLRLCATKQVLENIKDKRGFVYVLDKSLFKKFSGMEWRSEQIIKPNGVILVTAEDLFPNIQLMDKDFNPIK
jgi:hypothetical protein